MKRHPGQTIALAFAILCYAGAAACALGAVFYDSGMGSDPVQASLIAAVVFFAGCGIVLQVIATTRLRGVLSGSDDHDHP